MSDLDDKFEELLEDNVQRLKEKTPVRTGRAREGWEIRDNKIENDVEYIGYLEFGSATRVPHGMMGTTLSEIPGAISRIFSK